MQKVFVIDQDKNPMGMSHPARARKLLDVGRASVYRFYPFTIILHDRRAEQVNPQSGEIRIDPGAKTTGIAITINGKVQWVCHLKHRGDKIRKSLIERRQIRRGRRSRKTRYREPRFDNRKREDGWLPPSIRSRVDNTETWINRLSDIVPIDKVVCEVNKFDPQLMENPDIEGEEYQDGTLKGYNLRQYLLEANDYTCQYCRDKNVPLEVEHIIPKSRDGTDTIDNLTIACVDCNQEKGNQTAEEFGYPEVEGGTPLKSAGQMNIQRTYLFEMLEEIDPDVEHTNGARTKCNRTKQNLPKDHWIDASVAGTDGASVNVSDNIRPLIIKAEGRGNRQMCLMDKHGFQRTSAKEKKRPYGFQTGDIVEAEVPDKYKAGGSHVGKVSVRSSGSFNIKKKNGEWVRGVNQKYCSIRQRFSGYSYKEGNSSHG